MADLAFDTLKREVRFHAVRSRGPGGQNVNKVSSAALVIWDFQKSKLLSAEDKFRVVEKLSSLLNADGCLAIRAEESRDLERNKTRALEKLLERLRKALFVPKPRKATKPTKASQVRRQESKKRRSETKKRRSKVDY